MLVSFFSARFCFNLLGKTEWPPKIKNDEYNVVTATIEDRFFSAIDSMFVCLLAFFFFFFFIFFLVPHLYTHSENNFQLKIIIQSIWKVIKTTERLGLDTKRTPSLTCTFIVMGTWITALIKIYSEKQKQKQKQRSRNKTISKFKRVAPNCQCDRWPPQFKFKNNLQL